MNNKVCIISTVHNALDVRIFYKEARSLATGGYQICLIAPHPKSEIVEGIQIIGLPAVKSKLLRMLSLPIRALRLAMREKASLTHFHDPELIWIGFLLKMLTGSIVIYDAHEDFPSTVFARDWIPERLKPIISKVVDFIELSLSKNFDAVITADPAVAERFSRIHQRVTILFNVPPRELAAAPPSGANDRERTLVHIGSLSRSRGLWFLLDVIEKLAGMDVNFQLDFYVNATSQGRMREFSDKISEKGLSPYVNLFDALPYPELLQELRKYQVGLIPFLDMEKYHKNIATKMFDYMAAGLAVVASDLPPQRQVVEGAGCGTLIEPEDSNAFVIVIKDLLADPEQAYLMGKNGWTAIQDQYCWEEEEKKLFALYNELMK